MSRFITFSRTFPKYHPKAGQPTFFVEKLWKSLECIGFSAPLYHFSELQGLGSVISGFDYNHAWPKHHTIRAGNRWQVGDYFSPRVWGNDINPKTGRSGPYQSKMITIAPDITIEKIWKVRISFAGNQIFVEKPINETSGYLIPVGDVAKNDGLSYQDFEDWFNIHPKKKDKVFNGQIICWNKEIEY